MATAAKTVQKRFSSSEAPEGATLTYQKLTVFVQAPKGGVSSRSRSSNFDAFSSIDDYLGDIGYDDSFKYVLIGEDSTDAEFQAALKNQK